MALILDILVSQLADEALSVGVFNRFTDEECKEIISFIDEYRK